MFEFRKATQSEVDKRFAYVYKDGGHPIYTPTDIQSLISKGMLPQKKVQWEAPDEKWQAGIDSTWWGKNYKGEIGPEINPRMFELRDKLLSFGGCEVCMPIDDEDLAKILSNGQLWFGDHCKYMKGLPSRCHQNSADLYYGNKCRNNPESSFRQNITIATGYGLSADGLWRQHSWVMLRNPRSVTVIETTVKRILYFGFAMAEADADEFEDSNS